MNILVTGATGFIGSYIVSELVNTNHNIITTGIEEKNDIKHSWIDRVTYIQHNFNEKNEDYYSFFNKPDAVIHLAWEGLPNYKELFHFENNLLSSYFFIKSLVMRGTKNVSILGTCFEYGMQNGALTENNFTIPNNPYALAKDTLRKFLTELNKLYDFDFKWIRLFYLYGEGQSKNSILEQLKKAIENNEKVFNMSGGEQLRDYLPVEKVAEYITKISLQNTISGIINCCGGSPISIRRLVEEYLENNDKKIKLNLGYYPYADYEPMAFWGDNKILREIIKE